MVIEKKSFLKVRISEKLKNLISNTAQMYGCSTAEIVRTAIYHFYNSKKKVLERDYNRKYRIR